MFTAKTRLKHFQEIFMHPAKQCITIQDRKKNRALNLNNSEPLYQNDKGFLSYNIYNYNTIIIA